MAQTLTIAHKDAAQVAAHLACLQAPELDTSAGAERLADLTAGHCFEVLAEGRPVGAYSLQTYEGEGARVAWVMAAAGTLPGVDLVASVLPAIEQQAQALGCNQLGVTTRRRGLIKKLQRHGFQVTGLMLRKKIT